MWQTTTYQESKYDFFIVPTVSPWRSALERKNLEKPAHWNRTNSSRGELGKETSKNTFDLCKSKVFMQVCITKGEEKKHDTRSSPDFYQASWQRDSVFL